MSFTKLDTSDIAIQTTTIERPIWSSNSNYANPTEYLDKGAYCDFYNYLDTSYLIPGQYFQGGTIAYIYTSSDSEYVEGYVSGIIVSEFLGPAIWGCFGTLINLTSPFTGEHSTAEIVAQCATAGIAARLASDYASDGYTDWWLPRESQLTKILGNYQSLGIAPANAFWSSTQVDADSARAGGINTLGIISFESDDKDQSNYLLAARNFSIPKIPGAKIQFSLAHAVSEYAQRNTNSGPFNLSVGIRPEHVNFHQYKQIIFGDNKRKWSFNKASTTNDVTSFIAIQFDRDRYKERIQVGSLLINIYYGGNETYITDNSKDVPARYESCGRVYDLVYSALAIPGTTVSGYNPGTGQTNSLLSLVNGYQSGLGSFGIICPDIGLIILNPAALQESASGVDWDEYGNDENSVSIAVSFAQFMINGHIEASSEEDINSNYIFIRAKAKDYNYSNNPSFCTGSTSGGSTTVLNNDQILNPRTYITSIGLYNDNDDLIAVAKPSVPLKKDPTNETFIRLKLDW